jgi:DeoR/GlpR family transcriptional regulator of sugar metabolism
MLTAERRQQILETLRRDGKVLAVELSAALNVSEDTIRRDLRELAEAGLLQRVHGGALPRSPASAVTAMSWAPRTALPPATETIFVSIPALRRTSTTVKASISSNPSAKCT